MERRDLHSNEEDTRCSIVPRSAGKKSLFALFMSAADPFVGDECDFRCCVDLYALAYAIGPSSAKASS